LKKIGVKFIDFTGGEPLLNKDLPEILSYAKSLGFFVKLSTNGFLYSNKANELKGLSSRIYFSFDTTSKNDYKEIRGIDGLNRLMESIKIAQENKENICLIYTATNENIKNISNIVDFAQKNKILLYIHPCFSYFNNESLNKKNIHILKKYFWKPYIRLSLPQLDFHKKGGNNPLKPTCRVGVSTIDIGPDSTLTVPCFHHYLKRKKIEGNLFSIYNSKEWNELYFDAGKYDFCKNCTIDCYFGMSYWDRMPKYFIKQNLTYLKNLIENNRSKK
jgi:MoaA/NifB/PqqE/SkfB family radical SAM enzyme